MKVTYTRKQTRSAFTLIEMIGVLAVIAILAAVLIPKVFAAINNSRVNNAAMSCQTAKTALVDHYAKYGSIPYNGVAGNPIVVPAGGTTNFFDSILLNEQFLDKPFTTKIGVANNGTVTGARVDLMDLSATTSGAAVTATGPEFDLDASAGIAAADLSTGADDITGSVVAVAVIPGVAINDARDLSGRIDGETMTQAEGSTAADLAGRVKYAAATITTVYVYLTHR